MTELGFPEVNRYALRTFMVDQVDHTLRSVSQSGSHWHNGACVAECLAYRRPEVEHEPPAEGCHCGVYATLDLASLVTQYSAARRLICVIAAEGQTIIGDRGLRTAVARVVGYWCSPHVRPACVRELGDARYFDELDTMLTRYGLPWGDVPADDMVLKVPLKLADVTGKSVSWTFTNVAMGTYNTIQLDDGMTCSITPITITCAGSVIVANLSYFG
jgi:hypothetical protein